MNENRNPVWKVTGISIFRVLAATTINNYFAFEGQYMLDVQGAKFTANKNEYMPIPQTQIDLSTENGKPILVQNQVHN